MRKARLEGFLTGRSLAEAYASADIFVFPSTSDTFGNGVLEAMASGLPVIVADQRGPKSWRSKEKTVSSPGPRGSLRNGSMGPFQSARAVRDHILGKSGAWPASVLAKPRWSARLRQRGVGASFTWVDGAAV